MQLYRRQAGGAALAVSHTVPYSCKNNLGHTKKMQIQNTLSMLKCSLTSTTSLVSASLDSKLSSLRAARPALGRRHICLLVLDIPPTLFCTQHGRPTLRNRRLGFRGIGRRREPRHRLTQLRTGHSFQHSAAGFVMLAIIDRGRRRNSSHRGRAGPCLHSRAQAWTPDDICYA